MNQRRIVSLLLAGAIGFWIILTGANLWLGDLNQDEGWYLYAAREVCDGRMPYRDFAFTQGPVLPYIYAAVWPLFSPLGVAGGRLFTALLGLAAAGVASFLAWKLSGPARGRVAALVTFILIAVNVYHNYFTTVVKTYSLCGLLFAGGAAALACAGGRHGRWWAVASGFLLVLASGVRISAFGAVVAAFIYYLFAAERKIFIWFTVAVIGASCAVFLPFYAAAPDNFIFDMIKYHSGRDIGGILKQLVFKGGFVSRVVQGYFVAVMLLAAAALYRGISGRSEEGPHATGERGRMAALWGAVAAVTLIHFIAPFPYDDYQVAVFPVFAALVACHVIKICADDRVVSWALVSIFLASVAASFSSPINQEWAIKERDRIWWRTKDRSPIGKLRDAAAIVREVAGTDMRILTQDAYLAVEAGMKVPNGLEMGPFSYYPSMSDEDAERRRLLNRNLLRKMLKSADAPVAAFSGYGLAISSPGVTELDAAEQRDLRALVMQRYEPWEEIDHFGQNLTRLVILKRKTGILADRQALPVHGEAQIK